jgi:hypothetical protein
LATCIASWPAPEIMSMCYMPSAAAASRTSAIGSGRNGVGATET